MRKYSQYLIYSFDRCLFVALDRNIINDAQRDELVELFKSQIKTEV